MKQVGDIVIFAAIICVALASLKYTRDTTLEKMITSSTPFGFQGKEWQCGYTPRQVDINIATEEYNQKLKKLRKQ
jgi:hypothetical protein